jgi:hypothetical protein
VIILAGALWFLLFRRPGSRQQARARGHRRGGTGGTSYGAGTATPPPAYSKSGLDTVIAPPLSLHERYIMESNAERGRGAQGSGEGFEMADLPSAATTAAAVRGRGDGVVGPGKGVGAEDVSPISGYGGSRGRTSPHPGTVVVV